MHGSVTIAAVLVALGSGCALMKQQDRLPLDPAAIAEVKPGETTIERVAALLGAPNEIIWSNGVLTPVDSQGGAAVVNTFMAQASDIFPRAYHYRYMMHKMSGFTVIVFSMVSYDTKYDDAYVFFDEKGVVTQIGTSLDANKASYSPFEP